MMVEVLLRRLLLLLHIHLHPEVGVLGPWSHTVVRIFSLFFFDVGAVGVFLIYIPPTTVSSDLSPTPTVSRFRTLTKFKTVTEDERV
jgi:hypothetical protein